MKKNKLQNKIPYISIVLFKNNTLMDILVSGEVINIKPCHCNFLFKLKTKIALLINHYIPRCPFYTTYFAFRRTGVHPPFSIL